MAEDELAELEEAEVAFQDELRQSILFADDERDESLSRTYKLARPPAHVTAKLEKYKAYKLLPVNRLRDGSACVELTVSHDIETTLRFLGFLKAEEGVDPDFAIFTGADLGKHAEDFVAFLGGRGCKNSTSANYL